MRRIRKMHPFKIETYMHHEAVKILNRWVKGRREVQFNIEGYPAFVADVVTYNEGFIQRVYEVTYKHPVDGKKLGIIQYWCYRNVTPLTVFEIGAEYIMKQKTKPEIIEHINCFVIDFNETISKITEKELKPF